MMARVAPIAPPKPERLLTVRQVAEMLGVSGSWVREHAAGRRRPVMPCVRLGVMMRFRERAVLTWLEEMERMAG